MRGRGARAAARAGEPEDADEEVDITALEEKAPPPKRPRNWLLSPVPAQHCKRENDEDDEQKHGEFELLRFYSVCISTNI